MLGFVRVRIVATMKKNYWTILLLVIKVLQRLGMRKRLEALLSVAVQQRRRSALLNFVRHGLLDNGTQVVGVDLPPPT